MENTENLLSKEQIAKLEKSRVISDAELLQGGAEYEISDDGGKKLVSTDQQIESVKFEMEADLDKKRSLTDKLRIAVKDENKELIDRLFTEFKEKYEPELRSSILAFNSAVFKDSAMRFKTNFFEDCIQETFIEAYKNIVELTESKNVSGWLNVVCRRKFIDYVRKTRSRDVVESEQYLAQFSLKNDAVSSEPNPGEALGHEELLVILREAINNISSPIIRDTAKMIYVDGLDSVTIMAKQKIAQDNFNKRAERARKDVKNQLDSMGIGEDQVFPLLR